MQHDMPMRMGGVSDERSHGDEESHTSSSVLEEQSHGEEQSHTLTSNSLDPPSPVAFVCKKTTSLKSKTTPAPQTQSKKKQQNHGLHGQSMFQAMLMKKSVCPFKMDNQPKAHTFGPSQQKKVAW